MTSANAPKPAVDLAASVDLAAFAETTRRMAQVFQQFAQAATVAARTMGATFDSWARNPETQAMLRTLTEVQRELKADSNYQHAKSELGVDWLQ